MKLLLLSSLAAAAGFGWLGSLRHADEALSSASACEVTVSPTPAGTCLVRCTDGSGRTCEVEVPCPRTECGDPAECTASVTRTGSGACQLSGESESGSTVAVELPCQGAACMPAGGCPLAGAER